MCNVLIVEDNEDIRIVMRMILIERGHDVTIATSVSAARDLLKKQKFDVVITDFALRDGTAIDVLRNAGAAYMLVVSGHCDLTQRFPGCFDQVMTKPIDFAKFGDAVKRCRQDPIPSV